MGWEEKLLEELKTLEERIQHLITFLDENKEHEDYYILCKQLSAMIEYRECLDKRVEKYNIK
jgi:hypothetical protein|nr:MAG TPA: hypothetical protein [Bacteriophage sp.]